MDQKHPLKGAQKQLNNYLRTYRKKAGLSQREVAMLLAYLGEGTVSRHEQRATLPPLAMAIGYEVIFQKPVSELFPGMKETMRQAIEERLLQFEGKLQQNDGKKNRSSWTAQKLAWLSARRNKKDN